MLADTGALMTGPLHVLHQQQALGHGRNGEHGSSTSSMHCTGLWSKEHTGHAGRSVVTAVAQSVLGHRSTLVTIALVMAQAAQSWHQCSTTVTGSFSILGILAFCLVVLRLWPF